MSYHWQTVFHLNAGDRFIRVDRCPELGFCRQTTTLRKGYRVVEQFCFFDGENHEGDPTYTLCEALVEAEYRKAVREEANA